MTTITRPGDRPLIHLEGLTKSFEGATGETLTVLDDIDLSIAPGEIVALLGRSGSGKSTLLRIIAGLIPATSGTVEADGAALTGPNPGTAMIFQSFALMPWLTVQGNVELGLLARNVSAEHRRTRARAAIDTIGLDGFESAYPRELSGGMRQRVGFARALVLEPDLLLMDEPFSALDVLTAENLRGELAELWGQDDFPTRSVCIVTHNIEEAVLLADRVVVLGSKPGRIVHETSIPLARPRDRTAPEFEAIVDELYGALTGRTVEIEHAPDPGDATPVSRPLPDAGVGGLAGLVELVHAHEGRADLPDLAAELTFEIDDILPLVDAAAMLGFVEVDGNTIVVTEVGRRFVTVPLTEAKEVFARQAATRAPLVRTVLRTLRAAKDGTARLGFFVDLLRRGFGPEDAERQMRLAIDWGRYAELYDYDADDERIRLHRE
ncbi:nitrate ABC transporter ATP-binding protein [Tsukamurella pulmonis]|uniref:NitT/TauT family transport system ATP-binding protein n=1 Tax=Tsukamurella pulmonis TaxID=47312 RepID=A0A1H1H8J0_9ACTN|nr:nitrate/sulfonate/bicarbonate ABC transporter ATP-binding protein [Tsukamurella pulmonis]KXO94946.1 nitrate ABC transporter ATP-binding protein [Tsukamurella pulmonis]SDR21815.1 NitT/TauT family transport system ATP-binding protein [Tsukamurella pulmonis]SUP15611.1 Aliphatic sulfonates import ATP-binding protein SsuB [Tsukamurella pulmonis]